VRGSGEEDEKKKKKKKEEVRIVVEPDLEEGELQPRVDSLIMPNIPFIA
jgi:hypothetical protein